jgi:hypothetical protein
MQFSDYFSVCNDTKWKELRSFVLELETWPKFRSKYIPNGYVHSWDSEWVHHFWEAGFAGIEWFELKGFEPMDESEIPSFLKIGLVGEVEKSTLRLYGHIKNGTTASLITKGDLVKCGWAN